MPSPPVSQPDVPSRTALGPLDAIVGDSELLWTYLTSPSITTFLCETDGTIRWAAPSATVMLGHNPTALTGANIANLVDSADVDVVRAALHGSANGDMLCSRIHTGNGSQLWCDVDVHGGVHGGMPMLMVTLRDASARMASAQSLKTSESWFRSIVNEAPFGIGLQDRDGNFVFLNARLKRILGTNANYLLREELSEHIYPGDIEAAAPVSPSETSSPARRDVRFIRPDGEVRWCSTRILPQLEANGEVTNFLWAVEDITARVRAEEDQARLYRLMETSSDLVIVVDDGLRPLYLNPSARGFLGIEVDERLHDDDHPLALISEPPDQIDRIRDQIAAGGMWEGELTLRDLSGTPEPFSAMIVGEADGTGSLVRISAVLRDIRERKAFEQRIEWEATHDPLTELPNRLLLTRRLGTAMHRAAEQNTWVAVAFLNLDNFRVINESLGHRVGDNLLRQTADKLATLVSEPDMVARFGADEFAILMVDLPDEREAERRAESIRTSVSGRVGMAEVELLMSFSAGVATSDGTRGDPAALLRDANAALHEAKLRGRDRTAVFNGRLRERAVDRINVETGLRRALRRDELRVYYQPQVDLSTGRISGVEALARWQHPEHGLLGPGEFVSIAEQSGLIVPIGAWILRRACEQLAEWAETLPHGDELTMGINLSGRQLIHPDLVDEIVAITTETGVNPAKVELEITESILLDDVDRSIKVLTDLKSHGLKLALDDFGTGYSSLTYLRRFPIDVVKIDRSFVDGIGDDPDNAAIVRSVVELAKTLGLTCIAEGIETDDDLAQIRDLGCDVAQGFLIAQPLSAADAERLISYDPRW